MKRFQIGISDLLLITALVAGIAGAIASDKAAVAFIVSSCLGAFIWHRSVVSSLWAIGMIGLGAGLFAAGCDGHHSLNMPDGEMIGWGAGMVVGGLVYLLVTAILRSSLETRH